MQYLLLIYEDEKQLFARDDAAREAYMKEYREFTSDIRDKGKFVAGDALQPTQTATSVRVRGGKTLTTDGPFAETKEQLGGDCGEDSLGSQRDHRGSTDLRVRVTELRRPG